MSSREFNNKLKRIRNGLFICWFYLKVSEWIKRKSSAGLNKNLHNAGPLVPTDFEDEYFLHISLDKFFIP